MTVDEYRKRHKRCLWCKHYGYLYGYLSCRAKKKHLKFERLPRIFCLCYKYNGSGAKEDE